MSFNWTREMQHHTTEIANGYPLWIKQIVMQLYHLCGFTNFSHSSGSGWDPTTYTKTGTNGSFTGSSKRFTDSTASSFTSADDGAYILIKDATNPENAGWYVMTYVDASNVDIAYHSGATEYPTSASGLSWWVVAKGGSHPSGDGAYCRIRSPQGWEIEFKNYWVINQNQRSSTDVRVSMNADWTGTGKILGPWRVGQGSAYIADEPENYTRFMIADTDGKTLQFWFYYSGNSLLVGFFMVPVTPYESTPARTAIEKYAVAATGYNGYDCVGGVNFINWKGDVNGYLGGGFQHWNAQGGGVGNARKLYRVQYSHGVHNEGFATDTTSEINARTGEWDILKGVMTWADMHDTYGEYAPFAPIGAVNESMFTIPGWNSGIGVREVVDFGGGGDIDAYHICNSIGVPWPKGITPQF